MNKLINIIVIIALSLAFISFVVQIDQDSNHHFVESVINIKSSKNLYLESEPIWIVVEVNIPNNLKLDNEPVIHPLGDLRFLLTNDIGDTLEPLRQTASFALFKDYRSHYYDLFHLQYYYGVKEDFPRSILAFRYKLITDGYHLKASIVFRVDNMEKYFYSNVIDFRVEKPTGPEFEARRKLLNLEDYATTPSSSFDGIFEKVTEFEDLYPNSVYLPKAQDLIVGFSFLDHHFSDTLHTYLLRRIKENPENYYNKSYLGSVLSFYSKHIMEPKDLLNGLRDSYKGTLLEKFIDNKLEEIEFEKSINHK